MNFLRKPKIETHKSYDIFIIQYKGNDIISVNAEIYTGRVNNEWFNRFLVDYKEETVFNVISHLSFRQGFEIKGITDSMIAFQRPSFNK